MISDFILVKIRSISDQSMDVKEREQFWEMIDSGENPLLSSLHSMTEKWGLPAILMALGDIAEVLVEDAEDAELTPNQRGSDYWLLRSGVPSS